MISYSFHLSNKKHALTTTRKVAAASKHNLRLFQSEEYSKDNIVVLAGGNNILEDVKDIYHQEFDEAVNEYNVGKRKDRQIIDYIKTVSEGGKNDVAAEAVIQIGDKEFWLDKSKEQRWETVSLYEEQLKRLQELVPEFKIASAVIHLDEASPHMHVVGVPVASGYVIVGRMGCVFSTIEDNHIHHINCMQELAGAEVAGIKLHAAIDVTMKRNHIHHATMGIWCDWQAQGTRITQNLFHDNNAPSEDIPLVPGGMSSCDVFIEVSHGPTLMDHNICLSKLSFKIASQGCAIVHNLCLGPISSIGSGSDMPLKNGTMAPRYTPYHIQHRTEVAGMMTFLHGDDRIYNNIFIQNWPVKPLEMKEDMGFVMFDNQVQGTDVFDDFPTYEEWIEHFELDNPEPNMFIMQDYHFGKLPVWINGNAYLNNAKKWKNEKEAFVNSDEKAYVHLVEKDGNYHLETNIYDIIKDFSSEIIDSDILGEAFEPEQRFENPDGCTIVFDRDYFGNKRSLTAMPGPFSSAEVTENIL